MFYYNFSIPFQSLSVLPCLGIRLQRCYRPRYKNYALADNWLLKISVTWKEGYLVGTAIRSSAYSEQKKKDFVFFIFTLCLFHAMQTKVIRNIEEENFEFIMCLLLIQSVQCFIMFTVEWQLNGNGMSEYVEYNVNCLS